MLDGKAELAEIYSSFNLRGFEGDSDVVGLVNYLWRYGWIGSRHPFLLLSLSIKIK
jgi:hypothetical protein